MVARYKVLRRAGGSLRLDWAEVPGSPGAAVWLRVLRAGVCGTDLQILRGVRGDRAEILGHEGVAVPVAASLATACAPHDDGAYAILNPVDALDQDRILGHSYDGLFGQAVCVPARCVVPADPHLPADLGPLVEPLATVMYGWQLLRACDGLREVGIWGAGTTAVLAALTLSQVGVTAHIFHGRPERLSWLARRGNLGCAEMHGPPTGRLPSSPPLDAAFVCVPREGAVAALEQALPLVRADGWIDLFGGFGPGDMCPSLPGVDLGQIRRRNASGQAALGGVPVIRPDGARVWLTGHRGSSAGQLRAAQRLLVGSPGYFGPVISDVISLERAVTFLPAMLSRRRPAEHLKVVIDPTMSGQVREPDLTVTLAVAGAQA